MLIYWALFGYFAVGALLSRPGEGQRRPKPLLVIGVIVTALLIGLRYEVGGDWPNYEYWFSFAGRGDLARVLKFGDPAYQVVNWAVQQLGFEIWLVNLVCGVIFTWGLYRLCKAQPEPWLAFAVAIPYVVIVVGMGYTRQGVALGILMAGLTAFQRSPSTLRFAAYVTFAALFHKTAVVAFPLVALANPRNRIINILIVIATSVLLYDAFLGDAMDDFIQNYIKTEYSSQGAMIRIAMDVAPAILLLTFRRRFDFTESELKLWRNFALAALTLPVWLALSPSSTAVDRIALYLLPLQIVVFSRVPGRLIATVPFGRAVVILGAIMVQFVWLNFASHADHWVPYRFYPFG